MAVTTTNLGVITAYGDAVAAGYTGTKAEWQTLMASYATVGQQAVDAKNDAVAAKDIAVQKATDASTAAGTATQKANEASASAQSIAQSASQITQNTSDISELKEDLSHKANTDGSYDTLTAGNAKQLLSNLEQTDMVPYNYRTAGGSLEIGDREKLKKIVGVSLPVNQLVQNGNFADTTAWNAIGCTLSVNNNIGTITCSTDDSAYLAQPVNIPQGHKFFLHGFMSGSNGARVNQWAFGSSETIKLFTITTSWTEISAIGNKASSNANLNIVRLGTSTGSPAIGETVSAKDIVLHDLTAMFGSTIADYIYSLETATAGAGVAWLKAHFPKIFDSGYIPYNAGTLEHVSGLSAHKMTGFNQWDEEWEEGGINANTGENVTSTTMIRSKNFCKCLPSTQYCKTAPNTSLLNIFWYDADKQFISASGGGGNNPYTVVTSPDNAHYFKLRTDNGYGTTYGNNFCISLHWDGERDGEYEPYEEHSYPLDSDVTLRGIPKLDINNNLYYDGDEYVADGTVTRRYGIVDLGTLTWAAASAYGNVYRSDANLPDAVNGNRSIGQQAPIILSTSAFKNSYNVTDAAQVATAGLIGINYSKVYVTFAENMTAAQIKTAVSGVYMLYTLKNGYITTEEADPYTEIQNVSNWGTEEFVTTSRVPVGHETAYQPDLRAKIEVAPESPDTDGVYIMQRENGLNSYVALASSATIQDIISRLEALEGSGT